MTLLEIYQNLIKEKSHKFISENLNISISALKRWETNKKVPKQYEFEILKLAKIEINMKLYNTFNKLPNKRGYGIVFLKDIENNIEKFKKIDWTKIAFLSTNSAYNLRTSQIEKAFESLESI